MKKLLLLVLFSALTLSFVVHVNAKDGWSTDFAAAKKDAAKMNLPILADFSGSDWCGWCMKLDKEVFDKKEFKEYAKDNLVLFVADFPRRSKQSQKEKDQNNKLASEYNVQGFPTVLLLDAKGKVLATTGYREGGPAKYVKYIKQLLKK